MNKKELRKLKKQNKKQNKSKTKRNRKLSFLNRSQISDKQIKQVYPILFNNIRTNLETIKKIEVPNSEYIY